MIGFLLRVLLAEMFGPESAFPSLAAASIREAFAEEGL